MRQILKEDPPYVSRVEARTELGRFLRLLATRTERNENGFMPMFSAFIDAEWHTLLSDPEAYASFCGANGGAVVGHQPLAGSGPVDWIGEYEAAYGPLTAAWFADASGAVDEGALATYARAGTVVTAWDCGPVPGGDGDDDGVTRLPEPHPGKGA
ncbi:hypothetical protein [Streptomyces lydicus]|uniref:hypothetical protein n=1 Tax=Streptomyces lydicus TaxID=47763 RepID=UPI0036FEE29C